MVWELCERARLDFVETHRKTVLCLRIGESFHVGGQEMVFPLRNDFRLEAFEWPEVLFLNRAFKKPIVS